VTFHFTLTGCSRGSTSSNASFRSSPAKPSGAAHSTSVKELAATIGAFIDHWNDHPHPFAWTKNADEIFASIQRTKTKANVLTEH
jgi:hypothetical protein